MPRRGTDVPREHGAAAAVEVQDRMEHLAGQHDGFKRREKRDSASHGAYSVVRNRTGLLRRDDAETVGGKPGGEVST